MKKRAIKLPAVLCCLGQAVEVQGENELYKLRQKDRILLYTNPAGRELYCLKASPRKTNPAAFQTALESHKGQVNAGMNLYKRWHDFNAVSGSLAACPRGFLFNTDRCVHIVYKSDKWTARIRSFIHTFKHPPMVWVNKYDGPDLVVLSGGKIRVTKEGITG